MTTKQSVKRIGLSGLPYIPSIDSEEKLVTKILREHSMVCDIIARS